MSEPAPAGAASDGETPPPTPAELRRRAVRRRFRWAVIGAILVFGLGFAELVVRVVAPQQSSFTGVGLYVLDPEIGYRLRPGLDLGEIKINSHGLRDVERPWDKPAGVKRVLVLGDSFAFTSGPLEDGFCHALQRELGAGYDVINSGVPGWSTVQQAAYLEHEGLRYDPDVVVVACFVGNDVWENNGQDQFTVVDNELVTKEARGKRGWMRTLLRRSHLYRLVRGVPEGVFHRLRGDSTEARRYHKIERRRMGVCAVAQRASWEPGWEITRERLARIKELAGRPVVLFLIPDEFQIDPTLRQAVLERYELDDADYDWEFPQRRLAEFASELGLETVDVLEPMRARDEPLYLPFDSHWNALGNRLAAEWLAETPAIRALRAPKDKD